jgi:capsular polysaccharide biosynthesis protein
MWLVAAAIISGLAAFLITSTIPANYNATVLVAIAKPRYSIVFDPKFETVTNEQPIAKAYLDVAKNDDIIGMVYESLKDISGIANNLDNRLLKNPL